MSLDIAASILALIAGLALGFMNGVWKIMLILVLWHHMKKNNIKFW